MPVEDADQAPLVDILAVAFEDVDEGAIKQAMSTRTTRKYD
jgi:hypothetical protein